MSDRRAYPAAHAHGIMFHHFHGGRHAVGQGSISASELESILDFVGRDRILDPPEWLRRLDRGTLEPQDLCLTFDDALLSQIDVALPVLERLGLKAIWFVFSCVFEGRPAKFEMYRAFRCRYFRSVDQFSALFLHRVARSEHAAKLRAVLDQDEIARRLAIFPFYSRLDVEFRLVRDYALTPVEYEALMDAWIADSGVSQEELARDLWMTDDHLRELASRGHAIGLHSYSHPMVMSSLAPHEQKIEYEKNIAHIRCVSGTAPVAMAHPANSYDDRTLDILMSLGIRCGFRSNMSPVRAGQLPNRKALELMRQDHANIIRTQKGGESA